MFGSHNFCDAIFLPYNQPQEFDAWMAWDTNPLYAILHEAIYCQGAASNWAAHRIRCRMAG